MHTFNQHESLHLRQYTVGIRWGNSLTCSGDQRDEHDSGNVLSANDLENLGITYRKIAIDADDKWKSEIDAFAKDRGYKNVCHHIRG